MSGTIAKWPGGLSNLRSVYVRGAGPSVPIYFDNKNLSKLAAMESLAALNGEKVSANGDDKQSLVNQLKVSNSKLPVDAILEVAKTLPLTESEVLNIFDAVKKSKVKKVKGRKSISKNSKKPLKYRKHQKSKK